MNQNTKDLSYWLNSIRQFFRDHSQGCWKVGSVHEVSSKHLKHPLIDCRWADSAKEAQSKRVEGKNVRIDRCWRLLHYEIIREPYLLHALLPCYLGHSDSCVNEEGNELKNVSLGKESLPRNIVSRLIYLPVQGRSCNVAKVLGSLQLKFEVIALNICARQVKISSHTVKSSSSFGSRCLQALCTRNSISIKLVHIISKISKQYKFLDARYLLQKIFQVWQCFSCRMVIRFDHDLAWFSDFNQPMKIV